MGHAYIVDACRTPRGIGKVGKGALAHLHPRISGRLFWLRLQSETISTPARLMTLSGVRPRRAESKVVTSVVWQHLTQATTFALQV